MAHLLNPLKKAPFLVLKFLGVQLSAADPNNYLLSRDLLSYTRRL